MNIDDQNGTTIQRRINEVLPPLPLDSSNRQASATADAPLETIGKFIGLAVFASDALSSTAYATQK
jgi:hypothetical protein